MQADVLPRLRHIYSYVYLTVKKKKSNAPDSVLDKNGACVIVPVRTIVCLLVCSLVLFACFNFLPNSQVIRRLSFPCPPHPLQGFITLDAVVTGTAAVVTGTAASGTPVVFQFSDSVLTLRRLCAVINIATRRPGGSDTSALSYRICSDADADWAPVCTDRDVVCMVALGKALAPDRIQLRITDVSASAAWDSVPVTPPTGAVHAMPCHCARWNGRLQSSP